MCQRDHVPCAPRTRLAVVFQAGGGGGSKAAAVKLEAEEAAQNNGSSQAVDAPTPPTPAPQNKKAKKMSNKQRFEFSDLEKDIESLGERGRELDALLAAEAENPSAG